MAVIPSNIKFVGITPSVDTTERRSAKINAETEVYTLQDFSDSLNPDLTPITVDGNSVSIASNPTVTEQVMAVIKAIGVNSGIALVPNGTGAVIAAIPDGTDVGGNPRGDNAVDLQTLRYTNTEVASGYSSVIAGGEQNTAAGGRSVVGGGVYNRVLQGGSVIAGGLFNTISNEESVISGGTDNTVSGLLSTIGGGWLNTVSSNLSTVSGGQNNTASTGSHATVVGGRSNTSSGQYSISGGNGNTASGQSSVAFGENNTVTNRWSAVVGGSGNTAGQEHVVIGGKDNIANGEYSVSFGRSSESLGFASFSMGYNANADGIGAIAFGQSTNANGNYSFASGNYSNAYNAHSYSLGAELSAQADYSFALGKNSDTQLRGQLALATVSLGTGYGTSQASQVVAVKQDTLTAGATTILSLDGTGTTNLVIPYGNNRAWNVTVEYVGVCTVAGSGTTAVGDVVTGTDKFRFKRVGGTSTIGLVTNIELTQDATMTSAVCSYAVGGSNDLQITFAAPTTANATTFRVVAKVSLVEVAW